MSVNSVSLFNAALSNNKSFLDLHAVESLAIVATDGAHETLLLSIRAAIKGGNKADALAAAFKKEGESRPNTPKGVIYGSEGSISTILRAATVLSLPVGECKETSRAIMGKVRSAIVTLKSGPVDEILAAAVKGKVTREVALARLADKVTAENKIKADNKAALTGGDDAEGSEGGAAEAGPVNLTAMLAAVASVLRDGKVTVTDADVALLTDLLGAAQASIAPVAVAA